MRDSLSEEVETFEFEIPKKGAVIKEDSYKENLERGLATSLVAQNSFIIDEILRKKRGKRYVWK